MRKPELKRSRNALGLQNSYAANYYLNMNIGFYGLPSKWWFKNPIKQIKTIWMLYWNDNKKKNKTVRSFAINAIARTMRVYRSHYRMKRTKWCAAIYTQNHTQRTMQHELWPLKPRQRRRVTSKSPVFMDRPHTLIATQWLQNVLTTTDVDS